MHTKGCFLLTSFLLLLLLLPGSCVPVNRDFRQAPAGIPVYVVSNGFHTDLLFPLRESRTGTNWAAFLGRPVFGGWQQVGIGWGDEGFYLSSRGGRMPGLGTTLTAAFRPSPTLMHVSFYPAAPRPGSHVALVRVSEAQFRALAEYVQASFARDSAGQLRPLAAPGYTPHDFFYRARGSYHAFRTCNDWTNQALKQAGIRTAWKTPLAAPLLRQLRRAK